MKFRLSSPFGPVTSLDVLAAGCPRATVSTCDTFAPSEAVEETLTAGGSS